MIDSNLGTAIAHKGALARLLDPSFVDLAAPVFAFSVVIVLPTCLALWVIYKVLKQKS